ncbi:DUF983 domain-containing protein [Flammeovirgaceae bacterium SG7u.132]|nr:DUF983 domain-containing protein [Flammeovirgaceae bacterium SG7u.132]
MFVAPIIPRIHKFNKMNETCPKCGQSFHPELGFYFGAMYFTYAFNIALLIGIFVASQVLGDPNLVETLLLVVIPTVLLVPFNFRLSRAMMLHLFGGIPYDPEAAQKVES